MPVINRFAVAMTAAAILAASPVAAEDEGSMQVGKARITVGGGTAVLTLPDVRSMVIAVDFTYPNSVVKAFNFSEDFGQEVGWNFNGAIEAPIGAATNLSLSGFWANIRDRDINTCRGQLNVLNCAYVALVDDPSQTLFQLSGVNATNTVEMDARRSVDQWGAALELKRELAGKTAQTDGRARQRFLAVAADIRGIDQDLNTTITDSFGTSTFVSAYSETLDTRYYGAYAAWGGTYSPVILKGLWERLGLQSSFRVQGGLYNAQTNYDGQLISNLGTGATSALKLSEDNAAFIGGVTLQTSMPVGRRTKVSLKSEYEYYSYVPEMAYNQQDLRGQFLNNANGQAGTAIGEDDAYSMRTSLRLTIGLGTSELYR